MKNKCLKILFVVVLLFSVFSIISPTVNADNQKVMWGKTELKKGQIGKITVLSNTSLLDKNSKVVRTLKKGEEYRIYTYKGTNGGLYGLGGGLFVKKSSTLKYETPSKSKLTLLNIVNKTPLEVHFIDVGQGDSILIKTGNGKTMLVDGGENGNDVVSYLSSEGINNLDYVVATHPDQDHIGGLIDVLSYYKVGTFINSGKSHTTQTYAELLTSISDNKINYKVPKTGDKISLEENVDITVLHANENASDNNDASIVIKVTYGQVSFMLTGDADSGIEEEIYNKFNVEATVLKAGHHGSDTSSSKAFIQRVKPKVTILSYGGDNSYGHPHSGVVNNLKSVSSKVYATADYCDIVVTTNGFTYNVSTGCKPVLQEETKPVVIPAPKPTPTPVQTGFKNCTELKKVYPNGVSSDHPAYLPKFDRDKDGWGCE
ncbi:MBL fold metallo-hydrolase [Psychrobacillus sp. FJAT-21963]|uniref:MBL fold metallo-hydrolase n=1 Tax=Psychrobacillus sp. FJAT-21963 TaxID=1712028 RepID=UPI0006F1C918|nr:MBL fold metallo-hydrolase [Psychrobacillus sp. FJAT-21963]KQL33344.1 hypothetical protein AN959_17435 [Psychrobacillus sp. FJAT-21963]